MSAAVAFGGLVALALAIVGAFALIEPQRMAEAYGLPVGEHDAGRGFVRATGIRDVALGAVLAAAVAFHDMPLIVVLAIAGIVLSLSDLVIAYHSGGRQLRRGHAWHFGGVIAFVLILAMALFAIGW